MAAGGRPPSEPPSSRPSSQHMCSRQATAASHTSSAASSRCAGPGGSCQGAPRPHLLPPGSGAGCATRPHAERRVLFSVRAEMRTGRLSSATQLPDILMHAKGSS